MLFNSLAFLAFFPIVVAVYWLLPYRARNAFLLVASYYFYMNWEPVYAVLIFFSTLTTWAGGRLVETSTHRKAILMSVMAVNLGLLFVYKYLGFIGHELQNLMDSVGLGIHVPQFTLLLPVGISFYTFQAVGYIIDVYRGDIKSERNLATYALFVSFFPQLVAGPIERARNLLPQFHSTHSFNGDRLISGLETMAWGYFMKVCVAESLSPYVDAVYNNIQFHSGTSVLLASFFFTFQIFCDFGGYSLIAIGAARCMGFRLMDNFRQPYLATSIKDFWRRWHISLSTWFADYVYIPLGGNRTSVAKHQRNLLITFLVSGIWHGANWTFVIWGAYHGLLQMALALKKKYIPFSLPQHPIADAVKIAVTFITVSFGWIFFRANSLSDAFIAIRKIFTEPGHLYNGDGRPAMLMSLLLICLLMAREFRLYRAPAEPEPDYDARRLIRSAITVTALIAVILLTGNFYGGQFIYFQF